MDDDDGIGAERILIAVLGLDQVDIDEVTQVS